MFKLNFVLKSKKDKKIKGLKIEKITINARDEIYIRVQGAEDDELFNPEMYDITLGGKAVEPLLSFAINEWNVMLPYITYSFHKEQVEKYLESIAYTGTYPDET